MKKMRFSDPRRAPHEYQLVTIKRLVGGVKVVQALTVVQGWHMHTRIPARFEIHDRIKAPGFN